MSHSNRPTETDRPSRKLARLETAARIALGLLFTFAGLNHLLGLVPMPAMSGATRLFYEGLHQTGYFFPLLGAVELAGGALLLARRCVPLALVMLAPVAVNATAFHAALAPEALGVMAVVLAAGCFLAARHRAAFAGVLAARSPAVSPGARAAEVLLGLAFVASGVAGLLGRTPPPSTPGAAAMMTGLAAAGYFLPALSAVQVAAGALLLARRYVGLALAVLAPIVVEIVAYRCYAAGGAPRMLLVATAILAAEAAVAYGHRSVFAPLLARASGGYPAGLSFAEPAAALAASRLARRS